MGPHRQELHRSERVNFEDRVLLSLTPSGSAARGTSETAAQLGVRDADWIKVETFGGSGSCQLKAKVTGDTLPDVLTTSTWSRFDATARHHILLIPCIKLVDRVKDSLTDLDEGWSPPPGPERLQVREAPLRYSAGVQLRYRRKTLFR
jgi:hypothetical protein